MDTQQCGSLKTQGANPLCSFHCINLGIPVALKINSSKTGYRELKMLLQLNDIDPVPTNVIKLLDHFEINGPTGSHLCLVL